LLRIPDQPNSQVYSLLVQEKNQDTVSITKTPPHTYTNAKTTITNPKHNPSESIVRLSTSLTVFPSVVLLSVGSHWFPSVSTLCSLANYTAGTHQQHPCIIQMVCRSPIDQHCTCSTCFCLLLDSPLSIISVSEKGQKMEGAGDRRGLEDG
jgi:hypothetical protein